MKQWFVLLLLGVSFVKAEDPKFDPNHRIEWLEKRSFLYRADQFIQQYSGSRLQWQHPYGFPRPKEICSIAPNWFSSYSFATITPEDQTVIETLGNEKLWDILDSIGINGIHTGPMELAGGIIQYKHTPSVDGGFDPISLNLDMKFGTFDEYKKMIQTIQSHGGIIIGDLIPGHTGRGYDFHLALRKYKDYDGLYHMIEIEEKDWSILPEPVENELTINLPLSVVDELRKKHYIVGELQSIMFYDPETKVSNWSASKIVKGVDGKNRRWVYLHYFKPGQPTLNWLDPSFAANRLVGADIINSIFNFKNTVLRIDANPFLGIEIIPGSKKAWSEAHPLAFSVTNQIAMMTRKFGGYTFQELNMPIPDIKLYSMLGPDLSYDFITRTAYVHSILQANTEILYIMTDLMYKNNISPMDLIHALQNHDEINYELVHFKQNPDDTYYYRNHFITSENLRKEILKEDFRILYNDDEAGSYIAQSANGPCATMVAICAAALRIKDIFSMTPEQKEMVKKGHLLLAFYNAMQPGVFALSGWDLVGAYTLSKEKAKPFTKDGDNRWINRGAYDLLGSDKDRTNFKIPKAECLYGPITKQIKDPNSFVSQLKKILRARRNYKVYLSTFVQMPFMKNKAIFCSFYRLPASNHLLLVASNFSSQPQEEIISFNELMNTNAVNIVEGKMEEKDFSKSEFSLKLSGYEGKAVIFRPRPTAIK